MLSRVSHQSHRSIREPSLVDVFHGDRSAAVETVLEPRPGLTRSGGKRRCGRFGKHPGHGLVKHRRRQARAEKQEEEGYTRHAAVDGLSRVHSDTL